MRKRIVVGVQITDRVREVPTVQAVFTEFGCSIKTRLGLHQVADSTCSTTGLILLEMHGAEEDIYAMQNRLKAIEGVNVQEMVFEE